MSKLNSYLPSQVHIQNFEEFCHEHHFRAQCSPGTKIFGVAMGSPNCKDLLLPALNPRQGIMSTTMDHKNVKMLHLVKVRDWLGS